MFSLVRVCSVCVGGVALVLGLSLAGLLLVLTRGPLSVNFLRPAIAEALSHRLDNQSTFQLGTLTLASSTRGLAFTVDQLRVTNSAGQTIVAAPRAQICLDPFGLALGSVQPTSLEVFDMDVRLVVQETGAIAISAGQDTVLMAPDAKSGVALSSQPADAAVSLRDKAQNALASLFDLLSNPKSPMAALQRVAVSRGKLVFEDQRTQEKTSFEGLTLAFDKEPDGVQLDISAQGPNGRWQVGARAQGTAGQDHRIHVKVDALTLDEVALAAQVRDLPFDFDMPISGQLDASLDAAGQLVQAQGTIGLGSGFLTTSDPDFEPLPFDHAGGRFELDAKSSQILLRDWEYTRGGTHMEATGFVSVPHTAGVPLAFQIVGQPGIVLAGDKDTDARIGLSTASFAGKIDVDRQTMFLDAVTLSGPEVAAQGQVEVGWGAADHVRARADLGRTTSRALMRLWPSFIGSPAHAWLLSHLSVGTVERGRVALDFTADDLAAVRRHKGPVDSHSSIEFVMSGASVEVLPGVPPLVGVEAEGHISGRVVTVTTKNGVMDLGNGRRLTVSEGSFVIPDTDARPAPAKITGHVTGPMEALADVLSRDSLKSFVNLPIDPANVHGQTDGQLAIDLKLEKTVRPEDTQVHAVSSITNFGIDRLVGKEKLDQSTLQVSFDNGALKATGQGRLFGAPATLELQRDLGAAATTATIAMSLDDAARAKQGYGLGPGLSGPVGVRMTSSLGGPGADVLAKVELDLTRAAIEGIVPGVSKPAGRPGRASFTMTSNAEGATLDDVVFDAGPTQARGNLTLDPAGGLSELHLTQVRLSPGDDVKVDVTQSKEALNVSVHGRSLDARPFLRDLFSGQVGGQANATGARDLDIEVKTPLLTGNNRQSIANFDLRLQRKGGTWRQVLLNGALGRDPVSASLSKPRSGEPPMLSLTTSDAGNLLAFMDFYRRMEGGHLYLYLWLGANGAAGQINIRDFAVRDEPALRRLVAEGVQPRDEREAGAPALRIDTTLARFSKLQANIQRIDGRIDVRNGSVFGQQIGLTLDGSLDFPRDEVNLSGTFVPAYGVNNLFSQIPVFGLLLGGNQHEGLFGVNFRINGPASAPVLTINPLSAIAPGFLRKIFGAVETGGTTTEPPPQLTTPQPVGQPLRLGPQ